MYSYFALADDEAIPQEQHLLSQAGIKDGKHTYSQPCTAFVDQRCIIYSSCPTICRTFRCRTLFDFEENLISFDEALERIHEAREAKATVEGLIGIERSSAKARLEFCRVEALKASERSMAESKLAIGILEILLDRNFRLESQKILQSDDCDLAMPGGEKIDPTTGADSAA